MATFQVKSSKGTTARIVARNKSVYRVTATHRGAPGDDGKSTYQEWLDLGNTGTEQDFLNSLQGTVGGDGKSAYQLWLDAGNIGDQAAFFESLKGAKGDQGNDGFYYTFNVKDYGALGDGSTNDSAAFQATINDAATHGGQVYVPEGTYRIMDVYLASYVSLLGDGIGSTILKLIDAVPTGNHMVIRVANGSDVDSVFTRVANLTIDGNKAYYTSANTQRLYGYYLGTSTANVADHYVDHVEFKNCKTYAMDVVGATRVQITDCTSHDNGWTTGTQNGCSGFEVLGDDISMTNCRAYNNSNKGFISGESGKTRIGSKFVNCVAENNTFEGFYLHTNLTSSSIIGGEANGNLRGVSVNSGANKIRIIGMEIYGNVGNGIRVDSSNNVVIMGNQLDGNATGSTGDPEMYFTNGTYCVAVGNNINSVNSNTSIVEQGTSDYNDFRTNKINKTFTVIGTHSTKTDAVVVTGVPTVFNVKDYGALGDGSTNDTTAFQNAVTAATAAGGGTVYAPAGTYILLNVTLASNITLKGAGRGATVLKLSSSAATGNYVVRVTSSGSANGSFIAIQDLTVDGNKSAFTSGSTITLHGIYAGTTSGTVTDVAIKNVEITNVKTNPLFTQLLTRLKLENVYSHDNGFSSGTNNTASGLSIISDDVSIIDCHVSNNTGRGITVGSSSGNNFGIHIMDVIALSNTQEGIYFHDGVYESSVIGGQSNSNTTGVTFGVNSTRNSVIGLTAVNNSSNGIRLDTVTYITVIGNILNANATASTGNPEIYLTNATHNIVSSNSVTSSNSTTSIVENGTADYNTFRGNHINKTFTVIGANSTTSDGGGSGTTNLTATVAPTSVIINSDTGTDATIPLADATNAGLMAPAQYTKLGGIATSADVTSATNVGSSMTGATAKTTPVDADTLPLNDSAASNALKKVTWANIKATLKTYFDTLYAAISHTHVATTDLTATGTKNNTTFLRGDDTWAVPSGGGASVGSTVPSDSGNAAAGSGSNAARDDHVHAEYNWTPVDHGLLAWTYDVKRAGTGTALATSGTIYTTRIKVPKAITCTNIVAFVTSGGATLTSGQNFAAIYDNSLVFKGVTADQSTAWSTSGTKTMAISGGAISLAAGTYIIAVWSNATTRPSFLRDSSQSSINLNLSNANSIYGTANTSVTTTAPTPLGTLSPSAQGAWWFGLS